MTLALDRGARGAGPSPLLRLALDHLVWGILAVILIGKGVGALQEAGTLSVTPVPGVPRITALGLFPTVESLGAQLLMIAALAIGFRSASRPRPEPVPAE